MAREFELEGLNVKKGALKVDPITGDVLVNNEKVATENNLTTLENKINTKFSDSTTEIESIKNIQNTTTIDVNRLKEKVGYETLDTTSETVISAINEVRKESREGFIRYIIVAASNFASENNPFVVPADADILSVDTYENGYKAFIKIPSDRIKPLYLEHYENDYDVFIEHESITNNTSPLPSSYFNNNKLYYRLRYKTALFVFERRSSANYPILTILGGEAIRSNPLFNATGEGLEGVGSFYPNGLISYSTLILLKNINNIDFINFSLTNRNTFPFHFYLTTNFNYLQILNYYETNYDLTNNPIIKLNGTSGKIAFFTYTNASNIKIESNTSPFLMRDYLGNDTTSINLSSQYIYLFTWNSSISRYVEKRLTFDEWLLYERSAKDLLYDGTNDIGNGKLISAVDNIYDQYVSHKDSTTAHGLDTNAVLTHLSDTTSNPHNVTFSHENLLNIQGGTTNQYYHLTQQEYTDLQNKALGENWSFWVSGDLEKNKYYWIDLSGGPVTLDLWSNPQQGDFVVINDLYGLSQTNNITIRANGGATPRIDGVDENLVLDVNNIVVKLIYVNATFGWNTLIINK